ncbi:AraC family transcriptional regulator [Pleomorphovibrio marinus]|uniref:AraC family transcriptional regulator n=1 Tax=Pleomorphovibrio marinus TaxID=2164132 RepID=UPI000E0B2659|nr:AraC family transcriptional regulator [Pleomorphovibrio marinus]
MDVLSEVLKVVRLTGGLFFTTECTSPWSVSTPSASQLGKLMNTRAECITLFHILVEGKCWMVPENQEPFRIDGGSLVIFPHSPEHVMCSDRNLTPVPVSSLLPFSEGVGVPKLQFGNHGEKARLICGYLQCDQRFNPLIGALPEVLVISPADSCLWESITDKQQPTLSNMMLREAGDWLDSTLKYMENEASGTGSGSMAMTVRLAEILFLEVLKRYIHQLPTESRGWLTAIKDREIGKALRLLHARPHHKWSVSELAKEVGASRSGLTKRFTDIVGEPPIKYLTGWRIQLAKQLLLQPGQAIQQVSLQVGYESEEAFSRAFKRHTGEPPASWRAKVVDGE